MATVINDEEVIIDYTSEQGAEAFDKVLAPDGKLFVLVADEEQKCKRFFHSKEAAEAFFEARLNKQMTPKIQGYDFSGGTVPGEEQYKMSFNILNGDDASTYGTTAKLRFTFATADTLNGNKPTEEMIEVFFTFVSNNGTKTDTKRFQYSSEVTQFDITEYLEPNENNITLVVTGMTSGLTLTTRATYNYVDLPFSSSFDISADRQVGVNFGIPYSISGPGTKEVEFVMDFGTPFNDTVYDGTANKTYNYANGLTAGVHVLQMKAKTTVNNKVYESELLYLEFVVNGEGLVLTTALISAVFPSGTSYFMNRKPGLIGEQFVDYTLKWAYFSTSKPNATVMWKTKLNGVETVVGSREVDEMEGTVGVMPDPVKFQPDTVGKYDLCAYIKGEEPAEDNDYDYIGEYTITVSQNSAGLREPSGYLMKLTAKGRSNSEPSETLKDWSNNGYKTTFNNKMTMDGLAGWTGDALRFDNGGTGIVGIKPFATENSVLTNGGAVVFHYKTRNVQNENAWLIKIGDPDASSTAFFGIKGKEVIFRPSNGKAMEYEFAAEEETWFAVIVHPKTGVTDAQMMFFAFNGIEAPGTPYGDTAVFNIGSNSDTESTNGMIHIGNAANDSAIDVYDIYVYNSMLSMWQIMNLDMINRGGDVAKKMKKNNIFTNNNFDTPNINTIKENFRTLEIIGNLGQLEESNKKVSFFGSAIYTDPFNPKFNFYRIDGGAYIETAGQSRLEDLMAKSFHLDMNENDTVALYQDGKLCHKNRFIFADNNITENAVRIDVCGADSSMCRNAAHMKLVNKFYPNIQVTNPDLEYNGYVLRTPAQQYALSGQWSKDMVTKYGGAEADYPWTWNINIAPDSVPIVVVWHEKEDDPIKVYGLAMMTQEKKASYANGCHSIHIKAPLADGTLDPLDRYPGKADGKGWNNDGVYEIEYVNPTDITNNKSLVGFDDEETRDYSFESCFPKKKDLEDGGAEMWRIFKTEFLKPITDTYNNQTAFDAAVGSVIHWPSWAMYYNKCLDRKMNDSFCRNMHVIRFNFGTATTPKWRWVCKWWDGDVSVGLFQSNAMGVDPQTDRQTKDSNGNYVMAGHDMWLWNALEKNETFKTWCKVMAEASFKAGWSAKAEKEMMASITGEYSEGLYNLDQLLKFLYAYRKGNDYMVRMQGRSTPYRNGFIDASYAYTESLGAYGSYAATSMSFRATNATYPAKVKLSSTVEWRFGLGTTTTNIKTGVIIKPSDGVKEIQIPSGTTLGRDFLSVYGADKIKTLDVSDFCKYLSVQVNLGNLTQIQKLHIGYPSHTALTTGGFNNDSTVSFTGAEAMSRLTELSLIGLHGLSQFDLKTANLNHLTHLYLSGTGLLNFVPADGTKFTTLELPDTLQTIEAKNVTLGSISFWSADLTANTLTEMTSVPTSLLTLNLVGMGSDAGAHQLLHKWCQMLKANPSLINTAQITYRSIEIGEFDKDDLFVLAQIPKAQRSLTGYVKCNTVYTSAERATLSNAFGSNVFDNTARSLTLVCDGNGDGLSLTVTGNTVTATETTATMEQGNTAQFTAAGFPISGSSAKNYRWGAMVNGENTILDGNDEFPNVMLDANTSINRLTGVLTTTEGTQASKQYTIVCMDVVTGVMGQISLTVNPRSYPSSVSISFKGGSSSTSTVGGELQITSIGHYRFKAEHLPASFTGRMALTDGGKWTIVDGADNIQRHNEEGYDSTVDFCLQVTSLNGEQSIKLRYESNWRNGSKLNAEDFLIAVIAVIEQALGSTEGVGNPVLFQKIQQMGITPSSATYFSSSDLKLVSGTIDLTDSTLTDFRSRSLSPTATYVVTRFFKNVTGLNLTGCTSLSQAGLDEALEQMPWLRSINTEGTSLNVKPTALMSEVRGGSPTELEIIKCPLININVE